MSITKIQPVGATLPHTWYHYISVIFIFHNMNNSASDKDTILKHQNSRRKDGL